MLQHLCKLVTGALVVSVALWAADPLLGTWKLNLEKSNYGTQPAPKSSTTTWAAQKGGMFKYTADGIGANGQPVHTEWSGKFDGKQYPMTGQPRIDTAAIKRIDARTTEATGRKAGKTVLTVKSVVSKDGKTSTASWSATDDQGQAQTWTTVVDRQ